MSRRVTGLRTAALALGFGFLYLPIALLVAYSFNASRLVAVWGGWSVYGALIADGKFRAAALASLEIGVMAASLSLVLGTCSGLAMARCRRFPGRLVFGFMLMAPLVVPEVILGLSLLLLFVASQTWLGWPASRGIGTVTIAHATFGSCFVAVLVRAQLAGFDRSLEEAALDLGARPGSVLWRVTLPGISPALVSGWLLAFTLSLDDLVVASFVSGPSATTLPMAVYSSVRIGVTPEINALATIFIGVVTVVVALAFLLIARQERRRLGALAIVAALCAANADAMAAGVDAARIAAIDKAAAAFAVLAKDAYRSGAPPREAEPAVGKLLGTLFDTAGLNGSSAPPFTEVDVLNDWLSRLAQVGMATSSPAPASPIPQRPARSTPRSRRGSPPIRWRSRRRSGATSMRTWP
jgi:putrescine transport system permease protein